MTDPPIYLDHQASTPTDKRVVAAMLPWFAECPGNPHSADHEAGRSASAAVEAARAEVAALVGAEAREIVFTSGATEANNLAIKGAARFARRQGTSRNRIVTVATEHECVLESVRACAEDGFEPVMLPVRADGLLDPDDLRTALAVPTLLVSVMAVNNETGVVQDIGTLARLAREAGALMHVDAAQAAGRIGLDVAACDLMSLSAHKLYGPKGIGALYVRRRPRARLAPLFSGGGQERGLRAGTVPVPLAVGFGAACRLAAAERDAETARLLSLRGLLWDRLRASIPGLRLNGHATRRIAGNLNLTFPGVTAAALMAATPTVCLSTGSACSSAALAPSHVLRAMGLPDAEIACSLRVGLGRPTSRADIDRAADALIASFRTLSAPVAA